MERGSRPQGPLRKTWYLVLMFGGVVVATPLDSINRFSIEVIQVL